MPTPGTIAIIILVILILAVIVSCIQIVQQSKAYVIERLGAFHSVWGVGMHFKLPFIERVVKKVSLKEQVADFDPQPVITKDNVTMQIDTVIYFQITDPKLYTYGVEYPMSAIENLTATTLRNIIGELELDQSLTSRDTINAKMRSILDEATDPWGIKVNRVELKNILPPREIQNAMEKQMKAERERRESILQAEGEKASKVLIAEGEKQSTLLRADAAKQAKIMAAEAEAESILKVQQAMADSMRMLNENAPNDQVIRITVDSILGTEPARLPAFLMRWLSWPVLEARPLTALWWAAGGVLLTALLRGVCSYGQRLQLARGSESYVKGIRDDLYRHIQYLPFAWHKNNPTGDIIQRCTSDVDVIRQFVCNQLVEVVRTVFLIALYLCIMFSMNLRLSLISALFIPIVGLSSGVFYRKISGRFQAADEAEGDLTTCAQENLTAVRVVRAFGRERYEDEKFNAKNQRFSQLWIRLGKLLSVYWASGTLLTCLQVMVIVVTGACECVAGRMTLGTFVAFVTYNEALSWPVRSLGRVLSDMSKAGVSMDRVGYILNAREEQDAPDAVDAADGDIVFDHVTFGYQGQPVLRDVSFTIRKGETFAILGGTGSGKSTLVHLLDRLYDLPEGSGAITIGGVDIRHMKRKSLRRQIGLVLQEPFLFSQTVGENICAVRPDAETRPCAVPPPSPAWTRPSPPSPRGTTPWWASGA